MNDKFWVIIRNGSPALPSKEEAVKEATRLAELTPGVNHYVLETVGVAHVHAPVPIYAEYGSDSGQMAVDITGAQDISILSGLYCGQNTSILKGIYTAAPRPGEKTIVYGAVGHLNHERIGDAVETEPQFKKLVDENGLVMGTYQVSIVNGATVVRDMNSGCLIDPFAAFRKRGFCE